MEPWFGLVSVGVALFAIGLTVWATRKWGNRRGRIEWSFDSVPLLPEDIRTGLLSFSFRDIPVENPHLVTVALVNTGSKDVPSSAFDGSRPIDISFGQMFYGVTSLTGGVQLTFPAVGTPAKDAVIHLRPHLLKRREAWSFTAVLGGSPKLSIESPLVDTDVRMSAKAGEATEITVRLSVLGVSAEIPLKVHSRR